MRLIANKTLYRGGGFRVLAEQEFDADPDAAKILLRNGTAREPEPPRVVFEQFTPVTPVLAANASPEQVEAGIIALLRETNAPTPTGRRRKKGKA